MAFTLTKKGAEAADQKSTSRFFRYAIVLGLIAIPAILIYLPANYFDQGKSLSVFAWFGAEDLVYSTGMTRAIMHLIHLDFQTAWTFNALSFIVLPMIGILWLRSLLKCFGARIFRRF